MNPRRHMGRSLNGWDAGATGGVEYVGRVDCLGGRLDLRLSAHPTLGTRGLPVRRDGADDGGMLAAKTPPL
jgi:hypothetical protein